MKFRKLPVEIEAIQWFKDGDHQAVKPYDLQIGYIKGIGPYGWVPTLDGGHIVTPGDWIITGVKGENYPCKPDIFALTYESVDDALRQAEPEPIAVQAAKSISFGTGEQLNTLITNQNYFGGA